VNEDRLISAVPKPIALSPVVAAPASFTPIRHVPPRLRLDGQRPRQDRNRPSVSWWRRAMERYDPGEMTE
jgi:hypothetical protein